MGAHAHLWLSVATSVLVSQVKSKVATTETVFVNARHLQGGIVANGNGQLSGKRESAEIEVWKGKYENEKSIPERASGKR